MSFRISTVKDNGSREASVLIEKNQAVISASSEADLQCSLPNGLSVTITEASGKLILESSEGSLTVRGKDESGKVNIRGGADFELKGLKFYVTLQAGARSAPRKKALLSAFGLTMVWTLLFIMIAAPFVLDAKIKTHESKGRHALFDKCSNQMDVLREIMKNEMSKLDGFSQAHQDIVKALNEEVEQMAWAFRKGGTYMSEKRMLQLQKDMNRYAEVIKQLRDSKAIKVSPLDSDKVLKATLPDK